MRIEELVVLQIKQADGNWQDQCILSEEIMLSLESFVAENPSKRRIISRVLNTIISEEVL